MFFRNKGTCSTGIELEIENGIITKCRFINGCLGNTTGLSRLVIGQDAKKIMETLRGVPCRGNTSCPDQLSKAIEAYLSNEQGE